MRYLRWPLLGSLFWAFPFASCAGTPATPEQQRLAEQRLLGPYFTGTEVGCSELQLEITGNFHGNVGQPAVDASMHKLTREKGDGYREITWTNVAGDPAHPFIVTIGEQPEMTEKGIVQRPRTTFRVVNQVRLRIYEDRRPLQLSAQASGPPVLIREAGGTPREVKEFVVADGVLRSR